MRLLITTDTVGGVWTFTSELVTEFLLGGHAVHLVSLGRKPSADQNAFIAKLRDHYSDFFGFTATDVPLEWMQNNEYALSQGEAVLQYILRSAANPDLILFNQFCFGNLATSIPKLLVAHSDVLSWAVACRVSALEPTPWLNRYLAMVQAGLRGAAAVVAPTVWMGNALQTNFFLPQNFSVIPNGINLPGFRGETPKRKLQAITAGRVWDEAKGLNTLRNVTLPLPLLVAGETSFEAEAKHDVWPEHLQQLGPLSQPDLHAQFHQSAIYLCTSRYEPFGLAPLEAARCGCAVVARDLPSLHEVWADGATYFTDAASLSNILQKMTHDPRLLAQCQARSLERAARFTSKRMADSYLHLFQTVLQQSHPVSHVA